MKPVIFERCVYLLSDSAWRLLLVTLAASEPVYDLAEQFGARCVAGPCPDVGCTSAADARALLAPRAVAALDAGSSERSARKIYTALRTSDKRHKVRRPTVEETTYAIAQLTASGYRISLDGKTYSVRDPDGNPVSGRNLEGARTTALDSRMLCNIWKE